MRKPLVFALLAVLLILATAFIAQTSSTPPLANPQPTAQTPAGNNTPNQQDNIGVSVSYSASLKEVVISSIERTTMEPRVDLSPSVGPLYTLRLYDTHGQILDEQTFTVAKAALLDSFEQPIGEVPLEKSSSYVVLSVPPDSTPASIHLTSPSGQAIDFASFAYEELSRILTNKPQVAAAGIFTIAVINELGAEDSLDWIEHQTNTILRVEPWWNFRKSVRIVPVKNTTTFLQCQLLSPPGVDIGVPQCANQGLIQSTVARTVPDWNAIIVVVDAECNCGSVTEDIPPIVSMSSSGTGGVILHELGHAIGKMYDEYGYLFGGFTGGPEPNCYADKQQCEAAIDGYPDGKCSPGCVRGDTWRPANRIMRNLYQPLEFGPIEKCIMGKAIAGIIGQSYECTPKSGDDFPGWIQ